MPLRNNILSIGLQKIFLQSAHDFTRAHYAELGAKMLRASMCGDSPTNDLISDHARAQEPKRIARTTDNRKRNGKKERKDKGLGLKCLTD
jgi:hypothetical protein